MPPSSYVHSEPKDLPRIDGPFATSTSRAGGSDSVRTSIEELRSVTVKALYAAGVFKEQSASPELREVNEELNDRVALWRGDITTLEVDAIVNAANRKLLGGGGVDGAIHRAAGPELTAECAKLPIKAVRGSKAKPYEVRLEAGEGVITGGHSLPAKHVIHVVGPDLRTPLRPGNLKRTHEEHEQDLRDCYINSLKLAVEKGLTSLAFSAISVGVFAYPIDAATDLALKTVRDFMITDEGEHLKLVVLAVFNQEVVDVYASKVPQHFPP